MASKDFTSNQIRLTKLIASGGVSGGGAPSGNTIGLVIYSASNSSDLAGGISGNTMLDKVGKDTFLFVSGNTAKKGLIGGTVSLFGGDLVVSGNTHLHSDMSIDLSKKLYFNSMSGDVFIQSSDGNSLTIDSDDSLSNYADTFHLVQVGANPLWNKVENKFNYTQFNTSRADVDLIVNTDDYYGTFFIDGNDNSIILGAQTFDSTPTAAEAPGYGADVKIMLSGTAGSRGTTTRGVVLVPGDMVISGTLHGGSPLNIGSGLIVSGGVIFSGSSDTTTTITGSMTVTGSITVTGSMTISGSNTLTVYGPSIFNADSNANNDFTVLSGDKTGIFVDSSTNQVLILSGGAAVSSNEAVAADINFFVSGSAGSKGTATRGTSVFGGDTVISGALYNSGDINLLANSRLRFNNPGENDQNIYGNDTSLVIDGDDFVNIFADSQVSFTAGVNIVKHSATDTKFNTDRSDVDFEVNTNSKYGTLFIDGADSSIILGHEGFDSAPNASEVEGYGADVKIMLSGTVGSKNTTTRGVVLVPGDLVVSGSITGNLTRMTNHWINGSIGTGTTITYITWGGQYSSSTSPNNNYLWTRVFHSGSVKGCKIVGDVNNQDVTLGLYKWNVSETIPVGHVTSSYTNTSIGVRSKGTAEFILDNIPASNITGSFSYDPGDYITFGFTRSGTGGAVGNMSVSIIYEENTMTIE